MLDFYEKLVDQFPIVSIEDPFQEEGWEDWAKICLLYKSRCV